MTKRARGESRTADIKFRTYKHIKNAIEQEAQRQGRSTGNMVEVACKEYLERRKEREK